jgi:hypothetical protein
MATTSLGRPKNRWENDVRNGSNIMRVRNWKDCIQDRHKWKGKSILLIFYSQTINVTDNKPVPLVF